MKRKTSILMVYILLYSSFSLYSQEITIEECIKIALENHPDIKASSEDTKISIADYNIAKSRNKLLIYGEIKTVEFFKTNSSQSNKVINIPGEDSNIGLFVGPSFSYNLVDPQRTDIVDSTRFSVDLSKVKSLKVKQTIICNVKKGYYGYLFARENSISRDKLVNKFRIKLHKAKLLLETGQRPILDVSKAEVDLADAMLEYEKAKNSENKMKTEILATMGIMDEDIEFSPVEVSELPKLRFALKELYRLAEENYPDIKAAKLINEVRRLNVAAAKSANIPTVDLLGSVGFLNENIINNTAFRNWREIEENLRNENWERRFQVGIKTTFPIRTGGAIDAKTDSAIAEYNKSKYVERKILVTMRAMIRNSFNTMNELIKQIEISELIIDNAQKHLILAQKSYENGVGSQLDMYDAEMAVLKSNLNLIKARYDYLITLADLSNIIGLGEEYLCYE